MNVIRRLRCPPALLSLLLFPAAGCTSGPNVEQFTPAHTGSGILFEFRCDGPVSRMSGELLAEESRAVLVVVHHLEGAWNDAPPTPFVARVERHVVSRAEFDDRWRVRSFERPLPERIRLSSRYPYGVGQELLAQLLTAYGQEDLVEYPAPDEDAKGAAIDRFREAVRVATRRYRDASVALAEGFRPIGPDTPAMGRHWVQPARLLSSEQSPERPAILTYIDVEDEEVLTGVAYALPADRAPELASAIPAPVDAWHAHDGSLTAEAHTPDHASSSPSSIDRGVAVLHAWVWVDNPAGLFVPENWSLPWARIGLAPPSSSSAASRAVALCAEDGFRHFAFQLRRLGTAPEHASASDGTAVLERARRAAMERCRALEDRPPGRAAIAEFERVWEPLAALGL